MPKKNTTTSYTPDMQENWLSKTIKSNFVTVFIQITAVVTILASLYITSSKLLCINSGSEDGDIFVPREEIDSQFKTLTENDRRIESKLDQLLLRK